MPDPGLDNKPGTVNGETSRSHQKLSLRENVPFRPTFSGFNLHPAALFRPGKPGHLPPREGLGGGLGLATFNEGYTEQRFASGRMISSPTVTVLKRTCF